MTPFRTRFRAVLCVLSVISVFSFAAVANPAFPRLTAKLAEGQPVTVVCFGDSVTGLYYHTGGRRAYTDMVEIGLRQAWPDADISAINAGISGHTTANALARIGADVLAHKPDLVTVMFGLNDMTRVPLEDYRTNLKSIVAQCRAVGAEVMLCTPNSVRHTDGRPVATLEQYVAVVREVAAAEGTPLADCYAAFGALDAQDPLAWSMMMSDEIHPNMAGHKHIAETIVATVTGRPAALADIPAPEPAIPHTRALIAAKAPIRALAMPPYDAILAKRLAEAAPESAATVEAWPVEGQSIAEILATAKGIRDRKYDLVFIAVPASAGAESPEKYLYDFGWILNWSLSFGRQEWDVVAVPPSFTAPVEGEAATHDAWQRDLIRAQDFAPIEGGGNIEAAEQALRAWLAAQRD